MPDTAFTQKVVSILGKSIKSMENYCERLQNGPKITSCFSKNLNLCLHTFSGRTWKKNPELLCWAILQLSKLYISIKTCTLSTHIYPCTFVWWKTDFPSVEKKQETSFTFIYKLIIKILDSPIVMLSILLWTGRKSYWFH